MNMSNNTYDILKKISLILVPLTTLILTLSDIWGFAYGTQVAATVSAIGLFIGACLTISSKNYSPEDEEEK